MSVNPFRSQKPKKLEEMPQDIEGKLFSEKIDGGNCVIDVNLPNVEIYHARDEKFTRRTYRYPLLVNEIKQGDVLQDKCTYIGEITVLNNNGVGQHWLFMNRQVENQIQINRLSKLKPVVFFAHHIIQENGEMLDSLTYEEILILLGKNVKEGDYVKHVPTFKNPEPLLERKGNIEGVIINDLSRTYCFGKRGHGIYKVKFLKEKTVKMISYILQDVGCKVYTDENKPIHLAGNKSKTAIEEIEEHGFCMAEVEFMAETNKGFRDVQNIIIKRMRKIMKKIISCPYCNINISLPILKDITFQCPNCGKHWEIEKNEESANINLKEVKVKEQYLEDEDIKGGLFDEFEL